MFIKEEDILLPMVSDSFTEDDWLKIAAESDEIGYCIVHPESLWKPERATFDTGEAMGIRSGRQHRLRHRLSSR